MKVRLLEVIVQAVVVLDDGTTLEKHVCAPVAVPAQDWPDYPTGAFVEALAGLQASLRAADVGDATESA